MERLTVRKSGALAASIFLICLSLSAVLIGVLALRSRYRPLYFVDDPVLLPMFCVLLVALITIMLLAFVGFVRRPIWLILQRDSIQDLRNTGRVFRWQEIDEVRIRGKPGSLRIDDTVLVLELRTGESVTIDLDGMDRAPGSIFQFARNMHLDAQEQNRSV